MSTRSGRVRTTPLGRALAVIAVALAVALALAAPPARAQLRDGFRGTFADRNDASWSSFQQFGFGVDIRGNTYSSAAVCPSGYLSLGILDSPSRCSAPLFGCTAGCTFDPGSLLGFGQVYGTAVVANFNYLTLSDSSSGRLGWGSGTVGGRRAFGFTWDGVLSSFTAQPEFNYFQVLFIDRSADFGAGAFDLEYDYGALGPIHRLFDDGIAGVGDDGGFSGVPYEAAVPVQEYARFVQCFRSGTADTAACPTLNLVPEPSPLGLAGVGLAGLGVLAAVRHRRAAASRVAPARLAAAPALLAAACADVPDAPRRPNDRLVAPRAAVLPTADRPTRDGYLVFLKTTGTGTRLQALTAAPMAAELARVAGASSMHPLGHVAAFVARGAVNVAALRADPRVARVAPNSATYTTDAAVATAAYPTSALYWRRGWQWNMRQIRADHAAADGFGRLVCIIDSGTDKTHHDLAGKVVMEGFFPDTAEKTWPPNDDHTGHGTAVASIVTSDGVGVASVAPGARLMNANVFGPDQYVAVAQVVDAIAWCSQNGADVINMSLGRRLTRGTEDWVADSITYTDAVQAARALGTVVVSSAGNWSAAIPSTDDNGASLPAEATGVVAVGATAPSYSATFPFAETAPAASYDLLAYYSVRNSGSDALGPGVRVYAPGGNAAGLPQMNVTAACAPSAGLGCASGDRYWAVQGTSFAAPHVAGVVALIASRTNAPRSLARVRAIEACLLATSDRLPAGPPFFGRGRVNAERATTANCPGL